MRNRSFPYNQIKAYFQTYILFTIEFLELNKVLTVAGLELRNSARALVYHFRGEHFWRSSSKTRGVCLSLLLSLKRGVDHSNVLVRLTIPALSVCFLFYRCLRDDFDEARARLLNIFLHHEFCHNKFF